MDGAVEALNKLKADVKADMKNGKHLESMPTVLSFLDQHELVLTALQDSLKVRPAEL